MDKLVGEVALSKKQMEQLLLQMGIHMKGAELRMLIDAFDGDGDGVVTMQVLFPFLPSCPLSSHALNEICVVIRNFWILLGPKKTREQVFPCR